MAMAVASCGTRDPVRTSDAMQGSDAMLDQATTDGGSDAVQSGDAPVDRSLADGGPDANTLCFAPSDCPADRTCCVLLDVSGGGVVSCQPTALCVPNDTTWLACATSADCPPSLPSCTEIATAPSGRPFSICQ